MNIDNPAKIDRLGICSTCGRGYGRVALMNVHLDAQDEYECVNDHSVVTPIRAKVLATKIKNGTYEEHYNNGFGKPEVTANRITRKHKYGDFSLSKARRDARAKTNSQP